jgi:surface antigen
MVLSPFATALPAQAGDGGTTGKQGELTDDGELAPYFQKYSTYLCSGYGPCRKAGYSNAGYRKVNHRMYWLMYSGHNCTNYAAYRMVKSGLGRQRPWDGTGMAYNWGRAKAGITDKTPMVGSIAWWTANFHGIGSSGHVAYVEKVVDSDTIIISEDSWSGDFHWRRITKGSGSWPKGFIHFNDRSVRTGDRPAIAGDPTVGEELTARTGSWTPGSTVRVQWLADGEPIPGATGTTLTPSPALRRARLSVRVEATARGYLPGTATSVPSDRVGPGTLAPTARPQVTGEARVDKTLELTQATWSPVPDSVRIAWYADGEPIPGATGTRLRLGQELYRKRITVTQTARSDGYRTSRLTTTPTEEVRAGHIRIGDPFSVGGVLRHGRTLTVAPGQVTPADARVAYQWLRDGDPVAGAIGMTYVLGPADVGSRMSLHVALAQEGYLDRTVKIGLPGIVTTTPELTVVASGKRGHAVVRLHLTAPGVDHVHGPAVVRVDGHKLTGKVVDGRLRLVVPDLARGRHDVSVHYLGTDVVRGVRSSATVRVLRK